MTERVYPSPISDKIVPNRDIASQRVQAWCADGERVVFTNGCFDILHPGHVTYLHHARSLGDRLIVGINSDDSTRRLKGPTRPVNELAARMILLAGLSSTDMIVPFDEDTPIALLQRFKPDILCKGGDYSLAEVVGADEVVAWGGRVVVVDEVPGYATTSLIEKIRRIL